MGTRRVLVNTVPLPLPSSVENIHLLFINLKLEPFSWSACMMVFVGKMGTITICAQASDYLFTVLPFDLKKHIKYIQMA